MDLDPGLNRAPAEVASVHLMGIGGVAMGALAGALKRRGLAVRGSDNPLYPPMSTFLADQQIPVAPGYDPANLQPRPDLVIVGNVIRRDNSEVAALAQAGIPYLSLPQALAEFFIKGRTSIVAAGTHGKTTTTALIASGLLQSDRDPGFLVGGIMNQGGQNFREGAGKHFVVEGDEYDTAFFDKRPKFVHYLPRIAVLTSVEFDHADIYDDLEAIRRAFDLLVQEMPADGVLIAWGDSPEVRARVEAAPCPVLFYGNGEHCQWRLLAAQPARDGGSRLRVRAPGGGELDFHSPLAGEHNALNTTACLAALCAAGLSPAQAAEVQQGFGGVKRRQEVLGKARGVVVVDDFAHHPTAVRETLGAVREHFPENRLIAVFEPRTHSSMRKVFQQQYASVFDPADRICIREPSLLGKVPEGERLSSRQLVEDLTKRGKDAFHFEDTDGIIDDLTASSTRGDVILIMSNGGFDNIHERLLELL